MRTEEGILNCCGLVSISDFGFDEIKNEEELDLALDTIRDYIPDKDEKKDIKEELNKYIKLYSNKNLIICLNEVQLYHFGNIVKSLGFEVISEFRNGQTKIDKMCYILSLKPKDQRPIIKRKYVKKRK